MTTQANVGREDVTIPGWMRCQTGGDECYADSGWPGMTVQRRFTKPDERVWDTVTWESEDVEIRDEAGALLFTMKDCQFPSFYSQRARRIIASKYMKQCNDEHGRPSMRCLIERVVRRIVGWGDDYGYYASTEDRDAHFDELCYLLLHQYFAFNSPVWFNLGVSGVAQQGSACYILSVEDTMEGIMANATTEAMIFKRGSGAGSNYGRLRSSRERLTLGGFASGPVSFMKGFDAFAGVIKSGGVTRRAAKMVVFPVDHPDILTNRDGTPGLIPCKSMEEKRAWALIDAGYSGEFNVPGNAYEGVFFQNANHSVRVTDDFMEAVEADSDFWTRFVSTGERCEQFCARDVFRAIAEGTHLCGDPGVQFDGAIQRGNTCPNSFNINATNPCAEYQSRDDTSCNLASIRVTKFLKPDGSFDVEAYFHCIDMMTLAMEMIVGGSDYPTEEIAYWTRVYRNLGLGHCDLGALLMRLGVPYDSNEGRSIAAMLASGLTARSYTQSARIAKNCGGPFADFHRNRAEMLAVLQGHAIAHHELGRMNDRLGLWQTTQEEWMTVDALGRTYGFRNANVTVEAPTGTISFLMDCDTTGIEPAISLVSYKKLVGGGTLKMASQSVDAALRALRVDIDSRQRIAKYIETCGSVEGCKHLKPEYLPVFDCAFPASPGGRSISWDGHLKMMGAIQPFISMAISKTVNMPETATVEEIEAAYMLAWKLGLKAVAIYRDNSKRSQPVAASETKGVLSLAAGVLNGDLKSAAEAASYLIDAEMASSLPTRPDCRERLPETRNAVNHKFEVGGHEGYLTVGLYDDGRPGEVFIVMSKEGSTVSGLLDAFATSVSLNLQMGYSLDALVRKFSHMRFEPSGWTPNQDIPKASSIIDYIFRWMAGRFIAPPEEAKPFTGYVGPANGGEWADMDNRTGYQIEVLNRMNGNHKVSVLTASGPPCQECGAIMQPTGKCHTCPNCGATGGCG